MKNPFARPSLASLGLAALLTLPGAVRAVDFHVTTAQELQNALTLAAANGADDTLYLAAGYYTGNFNFNSIENRSLVLQGEPRTRAHLTFLHGLVGCRHDHHRSHYPSLLRAAHPALIRLPELFTSEGSRPSSRLHPSW